MPFHDKLKHHWYFWLPLLSILGAIVFALLGKFALWLAKRTSHITGFYPSFDIMINYVFLIYILWAVFALLFAGSVYYASIRISQKIKAQQAGVANRMQLKPIRKSHE